MFLPSIIHSDHTAHCFQLYDFLYYRIAIFELRIKFEHFYDWKKQTTGLDLVTVSLFGSFCFSKPVKSFMIFFSSNTIGAINTMLVIVDSRNSGNVCFSMIRNELNCRAIAKWLELIGPSNWLNGMKKIKIFMIQQDLLFSLFVRKKTAEALAKPSWDFRVTEVPCTSKILLYFIRKI